MSRKSKGINAERELIHKFWAEEGWGALRISGSGSMKYPSADILATNRLRKLAIECKTINKKSKYLPKEDTGQLKKFADIFGAEPWIAIKFKGHEWYFVSLDDVVETKKSFIIDINIAKSNGLLFEEIINK